jgi:hypothetical protein
VSPSLICGLDRVVSSVVVPLAAAERIENENLIGLGHSEIGMTMRYVKIAEHYKVEAVVRLEKYRAVQMQEAVVKMQQEQQEEEKMGMLQ